MKNLLKSFAPPNLIYQQVPVPYSILSCPSHQLEPLFALTQFFLNLPSLRDVAVYADQQFTLAYRNERGRHFDREPDTVLVLVISFKFEITHISQLFHIDTSIGF